MCNGPFRKGEDDPCEIELGDVDSAQLSVICRYLQFKDHFDNARNVHKPIPIFPLAPEEAENVLLACNFLLVPSEDPYDTSDDEK